MKKICRRLTAVALTAVISMSGAVTIHAQEYDDNGVYTECGTFDTDKESIEDFFAEYGYIPELKGGVSTSQDMLENDISPYSISFPIPGYEAGKYFSKTGAECKCHGQPKTDGTKYSCDTTWQGNCDCRVYNGGIQCHGFAQFVYNYIKGYNPSPTDKNIMLSPSSAKSMLLGLPKGTFLRLYVKGKLKSNEESSVRHSVIISSTSPSGITVYHANYGGNCKIAITTFTWESFASNYPYLYSIASA